MRLLVVGLAALIAPALLAARGAARGRSTTAGRSSSAAIVLSALVFARMVVAVEQVEEVNRSRAELQEQLAYDAAHDSLTQLPNRARGLALTRRALARDRGAGTSTAVLFIDLDGFKHVNDTLGHRSGDEVLRRVADRLRDSVRDDDVAIRYGGDEFLVLLDGVGDADVALSVARRLIDAHLRADHAWPATLARVGASVGVALATAGTTDAATLIHEADAAAYVAKSSGRGRAHVYDDVHAPRGRPPPRRSSRTCGTRSAATSWSCTTSRSSTPSPATWRATRRWSGGSGPAPGCSRPTSSCRSPRSPT